MKRITSAFALILSGILFLPPLLTSQAVVVPAQAQSPAAIQPADYESPVQKQTSSTTQNLAIPAILERVAACESTGSPDGTPRQFNSDGSILWGRDASGTVIQRDCGMFQINTKAHADELKSPVLMFVALRLITRPTRSFCTKETASQIGRPARTAGQMRSNYKQ